MNYYNDNDEKICQWLENMIRPGLIPAGDVDCRSIKEVQPDEIKGYTQCHFFAGIAGWSEALRLAGWPADKPVWTGSCPCQPFSVVGKRKGTADERHLWPAFRRLIAERRPAIIFGEQVASKDGRLWLTGVRADLEELDYAVGAADLCAASVGSPHIRQRLWWVAITDGSQISIREKSIGQTEPARASKDGGVALSNSRRPQPGQQTTRAAVYYGFPESAGNPGGVGNTTERGREGNRSEILQGQGRQQSAKSSIWSDYDLIPCKDGKSRRVKSGLLPLAHGIWREMGRPLSILEGMGYDSKSIRRMLRRPRSILTMAGKNRSLRLKGYGNAICPQVAAVWIETVMDYLTEQTA